MRQWRRAIAWGGLSILTLVSRPDSAEAATVAAGATHTVVVTPDESVWVWGANANGQLGQGNTTPKSVPTQVPTLTDIVAVAAGSGHTLALTSDGLVYAWGANSYGQLGDNSTTQRTSPVLTNITGVVAIAAGEHHSVALALRWPRLGLGAEQLQLRADRQRVDDEQQYARCCCPRRRR